MLRQGQLVQQHFPLLGRILAAARKENRISQELAAEWADVSVETILAGVDAGLAAIDLLLEHGVDLAHRGGGVVGARLHHADRQRKRRCWEEVLRSR